MSKATLQQQMNQLYDSVAPSYDAQVGHGIAAEERALWHTDIFTAIEIGIGHRAKYTTKRPKPVVGERDRGHDW
jgi:hypothetical protein